MCSVYNDDDDDDDDDVGDDDNDDDDGLSLFAYCTVFNLSNSAESSACKLLLLVVVGEKAL